MANNQIALLAKAPVFDTPFESQGKALQIRNLMNQGDAQDMDMQAKRDTIQRAAGLRSTLAGFKPDAKPDEQVDALTRAGYLTEARSLAESSSKVSKEKREAEKFQFEQARDEIAFFNQIISAAKDQASYSQGRQMMAARGMNVSQIPEQFDAAYVAAAGEQTKTEMQRVEQMWKEKGFDREVAKDAESVRHNRAQERNQAGQLAVSQANLGVSRQREAREAGAPRGQIVQTDQGVMLVNPRDGTAQPVMANGEALQPKMKSLPAPIQKALLENDAALRKVDAALAAVEAAPDSLGLKNYLGDGIRQRTDPDGVVARALVADIGSLKIHDRSGAAVTAAETPRLKPFIPAATDNPATVKKKLGLFRKEYEAIQEDIGATYTREQGYRPPVQQPKASAAPVNVSSAADYAKVPSGAEYMDPNGQLRRKP